MITVGERMVQDTILHEVPSIARALERIADALEAQNDNNDNDQSEVEQ